MGRFPTAALIAAENTYSVAIKCKIVIPLH